MKKVLFIFLLIPALLGAQTVLTPEDAVSIALKNNYDILIVRTQDQSDSVLNSAGEAGMLPSLTLNGSIGINQYNIHQKYSNGNDIRANGVGSHNIAPNVSLAWTIFDGTKMFITKQKLVQQEAFGDYQFHAQVLSTTSDILLAYFGVVKEEEQLKAIDEIIKYNEERVTITETRFTSGLGPKTDMLQAKIDLNTEKESRIAQVLAVDEAKRKLNNLLSRDVNTTFEVVDSIPLQPLADRKQIEQKMYAANPLLLAFKTQTEISQLSLREMKSAYWPKITLVGGYNFSRTENQAGFSLFNQAYGWQTGLTLSMPLYAGGALRRQSEIATLDIESSQYQFQQASLNASLQLQNALAGYDAQMQSLELERENETMAKENMELALERLRLGQGTALEVAQAQSTLANSLLRKTNLEYNAKSAEINVRLQSADL